MLCNKPVLYSKQAISLTHQLSGDMFPNRSGFPITLPGCITIIRVK
jgi:hypothetical protein